MINDQTAHDAYRLTDILSGQGVALIPKNFTPLANAVATLSNAYMDSKVGEGELGLVRVANSVASLNKDGGNAYTEQVAEILENAYVPVRHLFHVITNVINPLAHEIASKAHDKVSDVLNTNEITVSRVSAPKLFKNETFIGLLESVRPVHRTLPKFDEHVAKGARLKPLLKSGITSIDNDIISVIGGVAPARIETLLNVILGSLTPEKYSDDISDMLVMYMLCRLMIADKDVAVEVLPKDLAMDMAIVDQLFTVTMGNVGSRLLARVDQIELYVKNKTIIDRVDVKQTNDGYYHTTVYVSADVYDGWIASGGTPEMVMGCVQDAKEGSYAFLPFVIGEAHRRFERVYEAEQQKKTVDLTDRLSAIYTRCAMECAFERAKELIADEDLTTCVGSLEDYRKLSSDWLRSFNIDVIPGSTAESDPILLSRLQQYCSAVLFPELHQLFPVIDSINTQCRANPDLSPREAAGVEAARMMIRWMVESCDVVPLDEDS